MKHATRIKKLYEANVIYEENPSEEDLIQYIKNWIANNPDCEVDIKITHPNIPVSLTLTHENQPVFHCCGAELSSQSAKLILTLYENKLWDRHSAGSLKPVEFIPIEYSDK